MVVWTRLNLTLYNTYIGLLFLSASSCWLSTLINKNCYCHYYFSIFVMNIILLSNFVLFPWTSNSIYRSQRLLRAFCHLLPTSLLHPTVHRPCVSWKEALLLTSYITFCISTINSFICVDYMLFIFFFQFFVVILYVFCSFFTAVMYVCVAPLSITKPATRRCYTIRNETFWI